MGEQVPVDIADVDATCLLQCDEQRRRSRVDVDGPPDVTERDRMTQPPGSGSGSYLDEGRSPPGWQESFVPSLGMPMR